jgi:hypothetical protein
VAGLLMIERSFRRRYRVFKVRFYVDGRREHEVLHERRNCKCGQKDFLRLRTLVRWLNQALGLPPARRR